MKFNFLFIMASASKKDQVSIKTCFASISREDFNQNCKLNCVIKSLNEVMLLANLRSKPIKPSFLKC